MGGLDKRASTGLKPEKNPTFGPVNSYGIHGSRYSARTTLWFGGKNWNSKGCEYWDDWDNDAHIPMMSPTFAWTTFGVNVLPP